MRPLRREPQTVTKHFHNRYEKEDLEIEVELFAWEKEDEVDNIKRAFGIR